MAAEKETGKRPGADVVTAMVDGGIIADASLVTCRSPSCCYFAPMIILALMLATPAPTALTDAQQNDIACVAMIATTAEKQRMGVSTPKLLDVRQSGKVWAGIVGSRITDESGQPRELIAVAMTEAAKAEFQRPSETAAVQKCFMQMSMEIANAAAQELPLPKQVPSK